jgi:hypothetical protein
MDKPKNPYRYSRSFLQTSFIDDVDEGAFDTISIA